MKTEYLRLGNILTDGKFLFGVNTIEEETIWGYLFHCIKPEKLEDYYAEGNHHFNIENIDGVPLTEEWLMKFGFEKFIGNNILWGLGDFCVGWYGNKYATWIIRMRQENNEMNFHSQIEYVHQLQNLYFTLTGKELITI